MFKHNKTVVAFISFWMLLGLAVGCLTISFPPDRSQSKVSPRESFVKVLAEENNTKIGSGSGAIIDHTETGTTILSAGHVCQKSDNVSLFVVDINTNKYEARVIKMLENPDLCLLTTDGKIDKPALKIAKHKPLPGDRVFNVAAPWGIHDKNMILKFTGFYSGEMKVKSADQIFSIYTIPTAPGSSGSPVLNDDMEIIGVTSMARRDFESLCLAVPLESIQKFISSPIKESKKIHLLPIPLTNDLTSK